MKITIEFSTLNAAFHSCEDCQVQVDIIEAKTVLGRALDKIGDHTLDWAEWDEALMDSNGNKVGTVSGEDDR